MKKEEIQTVINEAATMMKKIGVSPRLEPVVFSFLLKELWDKHRAEDKKPEPEQLGLKELSKEEFSAKLKELARELEIAKEELEEIFTIQNGKVDIVLSNLGSETEKGKRKHLCHIYLTLKAVLFSVRSASSEEIGQLLDDYGLGDEHRQLSTDLREYPDITVTGKKRSGKIAFRLTPRQVKSGIGLIKNLVQPVE